MDKGKIAEAISKSYEEGLERAYDCKSSGITSTFKSL